jgi:anthranilate phosphoribosyltransferase
MIVHGCAGNGMGLDEPSVCGPTSMIELIDGELIRHTVEPEEFGLGRWEIGDLAGGDSHVNAQIIRGILDGSASQAKIDAALFAAAIACYVSGKASCIDEGMSMSKGSLETCEALDRMNAIIEMNQTLATKCNPATN